MRLTGRAAPAWSSANISAISATGHFPKFAPVAAVNDRLEPCQRYAKFPLIGTTNGPVRLGVVRNLCKGQPTWTLRFCRATTSARSFSLGLLVLAISAVAVSFAFKMGKRVHSPATRTNPKDICSHLPIRDGRWGPSPAESTASVRECMVVESRQARQTRQGDPGQSVRGFEADLIGSPFACVWASHFLCIAVSLPNNGGQVRRGRVH